MYKCKNCGFSGEGLDLNAHLVYNKCNLDKPFDRKRHKLEDYCEVITLDQYMKDLRKRSEKSDNVRGDPIPEGKDALNKDYEPETVKHDTVGSKKSNAEVSKDAKKH